MWLYISSFLVLIFGLSQAQIPRQAFDRIVNFEPKKFSYSHEREYPTWDTFFKKLSDNPTLLDAVQVDKTCLDDFWLIFQVPSGLKKGYDVTPFMQAIDSSATFGPGIMKGHQWFYGLYTECKEISYQLPDKNRKFEGMYSRIFISRNLVLAPNESSYIFPGACGDLLGFDLCVPKSCSDEDVTTIMRELTFNNKTQEQGPVCSVSSMRDQYYKKEDAGTWIVTIIMGFIIFLGITASVYDYFIYPMHKNMAYTKAIGVRCWRAFSLYTNISETFNTKGSKKAGQIGPIHCMRFFSMCWVVMGHSLGFFMLYSENPLDVLNITKDWTIQWVLNAYFAVDTFFFQSGLLLAFIWFKKYQSNKRQTNSIGAWVMFYVHRILRLSPAYYILISFYTFVYLPWLLTDKAVYLSPFTEPCPKYWWVNYLYLNNYIHYDQQCYLVSWYLSTDLQIYIFAPILIIPFIFGPLFGIAAALIAFIISTVANIVTVLHYRFPASDFSLGPADPKMTVPFSHYTVLMYNAPWIRCQIFIIGILVGYLLQMKKKLKIHWTINITLWVLCFTLMILDIIALRSWAGEHHYMDLGWRAMYSAFSKPIWGLCLAWIIISCYYGHGGFINDFMSWNIWVPLGRLSYSAYLIHICVMLYVTSMSQNGTTYTSFFQMCFLFVMPVIFGAYFLAIFWSALFEFGFGKVEDILIGALIGRPVSSRNAASKKEEDPPKNNGTMKETVWDAESPPNGTDSKPSYTNDITLSVNNGSAEKDEKM